MLFRKIFLRGRQLVRAQTAKPLSGPQLSYIQKILNPAEAELFKGLPVYEQQHAFNVSLTLVRSGFGNDKELLQAALLHDLGKHDPASGQSVPVWVKVAGVILGRRRVGKLASPQKPTHWRYLFWLQDTHEERSARLLQSAGSQNRLIELVAGYPLETGQGAQDYLAVQALNWADDQN